MNLSNLCTLGLILLLTACASTKVEIDTEKTAFIPLVQFNKQLEINLNQKNFAFVDAHIPISKIVEKIKRDHADVGLTSAALTNTAITIKKTYLTLLQAYQTNSPWHYLSTETQNPDYNISHYRVDMGESGYAYVDLFLTKKANKIVDVYLTSTAFTTLNFIMEFNKMIGNPTKDPLYVGHEAALESVITAAHNGNILELKQSWTQLPESIQTSPILVDYLLRRVSALAKELGDLFKPELIATLNKMGKTTSILEAYFVERKNYSAAIAAINSLPPAALNDVKMQNELAMLYALIKEYDIAIKYSHNALLASPYDLEAFLVLLQVSLMANNFELTTQTIDVIASRFEIESITNMLLELDNSEDYIQSPEFSAWQTAP
ncbi:tetratricopeptide repeat protein [Algibacillus agarilyticus]|uniref:tetratricopeptide repeat protein n=1 Tax=Algibacillus agarilyticus TaxID=2234133 RepID=UPI000DD09B82|nr:hypothetical protein [Algibacillus agarilyticus]